jgi:hypothetical protein
MNKEGKYIEIDLNSDAFDYHGTFKKKDIVDWNKLQYNETYKSFDYWQNKFPPGFEYLPGFDSIIRNIVNNAKSPYEEMMLRITPENILSSNINDEKNEN